MSRDLDDIVGSVRVRLSEIGNYNLVNTFSLCSRVLRVPYPSRGFSREGGAFDFLCTKHGP